MFKKDPCLATSHSSYAPHSPHVIVPAIIEPKSVVLDVGCNTGYIGKALKRKKVICDGIDINSTALKKAQRYYRSLFKR